jgi:hydrogenase maturation protease
MKPMTPLHGKVLLIGYGNPGRLDDGLGPALAAAVRQMELERVTVESCYQLAVEHAEQAAHYDVVVFADAAVDGAEPFRWERLEPTMDVAFTTHSVAPAAILGLAQHLFQATTDGYVLGIRGYEFDDFGEQLSPLAQDNLAAAVQFFQATLQTQQCKVGP